MTWRSLASSASWMPGSPGEQARDTGLFLMQPACEPSSLESRADGEPLAPSLPLRLSVPARMVVVGGKVTSNRYTIRPCVC